MMKSDLRVLVIHHTPYHFEAALSFYDNLSTEMNLIIWSSSIDQFGREEFLRNQGYRFYEGDDFDVAIIVTGAIDLSTENCDPRILRDLPGKKVIKVMHRFIENVKPNEIYLVPAAENFFFMVVSGDAKKLKDRIAPIGNRILIQGNVEDRRDYNLVEEIASRNQNATFYIVGKKVSNREINLNNVVYRYNLSERKFRDECSSCDYIMPVIDPRNHRHYFYNQFTSSVLVGFSGLLPFIAHRELFKMYALQGFSYDEREEVSACIQQAISLTNKDYHRKVQDLDAHRSLIIRNNLNIFFKILGNI